MKLFFKNNWSFLVYPGWIVLLILFGVNSSEHTWARVGVFMLLAPLPIAFAVLAILAYGEWIFNMIALWQTDKREFSNRVFIGLGKMFAVLAVLAAVAGFLWAASWPQNQWVIWEATKFVFYFAVASIISFIVYLCYRRWSRSKKHMLGGSNREATGDIVLIRDPEGYTRVEVIAEPHGIEPTGMVGLRFLTKDGKHRMGLGTYQDEGGLTLFDETGLTRVSVRIENSAPRLIFWKHVEPPGIGGTKRIDLGLKTDGSHTLDFMDEKGNCRGSFGVQKDGAPFLAFYDLQGNVVWKVP
jgi:hypothetical protein